MRQTFSPSPQPTALPLEVSQRWEEIRADGEPARRAEAVHARMDEAAHERLLRQAMQAKSKAQRVVWLHRASDVIGQAVQSARAAPCEKGCAACCHMPVAVSRAEASYLAKVSNRRLRESPVDAVHMAQELDALDRTPGTKHDPTAPWQRHKGVPCPFLQDNSCSNWTHRPLACRMYFSLDKDNLLCQPTDAGVVSDVPLLNVTARTGIYWMVLGTNQEAADIRDWFPYPASP